MSNQYEIELSRVARHASFVICNDCFWCASVLDVKFQIDRCKSCNKNVLETLPIAQNERYTFDHDPKSGIILEFAIGRTQVNRYAATCGETT